MHEWIILIVIRVLHWREKGYCIEYAAYKMFNIIHPLLHSSNMHNAPAAIHSLNRLFQPIPTILRKESSKNTIICSFITLMQLSTSTNNSTSFFSSLSVYLSFLFSLFPSSPSFYLQLLHQHHLKTISSPWCPSSSLPYATTTNLLASYNTLPLLLFISDTAWVLYSHWCLHNTTTPSWIDLHVSIIAEDIIIGPEMNQWTIATVHQGARV